MGSSPLLSVERLRQLEEEAWRNPASRDLYRTADIPGFPWFTVTSARTWDSGADEGAAVELARRHVIPYAFTFKVFVKGRWVGKRLLDVYSSELAHHPREYYEACLRSGRLRCVRKADIQEERREERRRRQNGQEESNECAGDPRTDKATPTRATTTDVKRRNLKRGLGEDALPTALFSSSAEEAAEDVVLQPGDIVLHTVHRHEIPVATGGGRGEDAVPRVEPIYLLSVRIRALGLLSVMKPTGLPTHATGRYAYNALLTMMEYVLAPKRIEAWLWRDDPLLQSLVSTVSLTRAEKEELFAYYHPSSAAPGCESTVSLEKALRACHRLDIVTSGVLLLGVSQAATQRVSAVLMRKSKAMDDAASLAQEGNTMDELLTRHTGVRKRYLAKVRGRFPHDSRRLWEALCRSEPHRTGAEDNAVRTVSPDVMDLLNACVTAAAEEGAVGLPPHREGVLINTPIGVAKFVGSAEGSGSVDTEEGDPTAAAAIAAVVPLARVKGTPGSGCATQAVAKASVVHTAVTVFQVMGAPWTAEEGGVHSILQCIPFTGRLHQIRLHLSSWGFPVVEDTTYGYDGAGEAEAEAAVARGGEAVFFHEQELPAAYRELYPIPPACGAVQEGGEAASREPLCYECAGRLSIAVVDKGRDTQRICLHAWRYELDAEAVLAVSQADDTTNKGNSNLSTCRPTAADDPSVASLSSTPFARQEKGWMVFTAPLPDWAKR